MMDYQEYIDFYLKYDKTIDQISKPNSPLNKQQLDSKYKKYVSKETKKQNSKLKKAITKSEFKKNNIDEKWEKVRSIVLNRDLNSCCLIRKCNPTELEQLYNLSNGLHNKLTIAHIIPRSKSKLLYYYLPNLITLNLASHSLLDHNHHPLTGKPITKQQRVDIWKWLVGKDHYNYLLEIYNRKEIYDSEKNRTW